MIALSLLLALTGAFPNNGSEPSSHREAPFVTENPKIDATDFYMFRSYEPGRENMVTLIANYLPLQDPYGGPNYFFMDPEALYEIHIDNDGDSQEDITFQFRFKNEIVGQSLMIGDPGNEVSVEVPVINTGPILTGDASALNLLETYSLTMVSGDRRTGTKTAISLAGGNQTEFTKPVDNIGNKSLPDYEGYAGQFLYDINLPGTEMNGRMFVGQRDDPFVVNLGETFDLINYTDPLGPEDGAQDSLAGKNVTSLILEIPISFLTNNGADPVIGGWTTASLRQARVLNPFPGPNSKKAASIEGGAFTQVSRLGMPLVNEVVIGLSQKDRFNASEPMNDAQFLSFVTNPTLPEIIEILFSGAGVEAPNLFPRDDLVQVFLTGVPGLNDNGATAEYLRLNTDIPVSPLASQSRLGVIDGDVAGFPNGRRPGDDVVDIALRVVMGRLLSEDDAPSGQLDFTDGAIVDATQFDAQFPYLTTPNPGSPQPPPPTGGPR
ncbi:MAG: DUF4331 domain-containing protein [Planctomycetota bacterium]